MCAGSAGVNGHHIGRRHGWPHYYPLSRHITQSNKASGHVLRNPNTETYRHAFPMRFITLLHTSASRTECSVCVSVCKCVCKCVRFPVFAVYSWQPRTLGPMLEIRQELGVVELNDLRGGTSHC